MLRRQPDYSSPLSHFEPTELFDTLSTGIVVLDGQLCPIYANVSAQDFMAVSLRQARGRPFTDLFFDSAQLKQILRRALDGLETCTQHELVLKAVASQMHRDPSVIDLIATPLEEQVTGTHLLLELADATQRQRITRDSDILVGMDGSRLMIRQLAHEVKNPLGGLRGAAQLLSKELSNPALREYTTVIINEADRLAALVDSMAGSNSPARMEMINLHEVCEHVVHLIRAEAPPGVVVERDYDPSLPDALIDRNQIIQALLNVARNAMQSVGAHGRIIFRTRVRSGFSIGRKRHKLVADIGVEDNGPGVPPDLIKTIFLPLVTGRSNGSGLGLAVAQDLATRHDGIIEFASQPGRTVFSLLLPLEGKTE
jgi:two-component system, NtrC family, nitrogen regulation sensor histidine kinase GlnL